MRPAPRMWWIPLGVVVVVSARHDLAFIPLRDSWCLPVVVGVVVGAVGVVGWSLVENCTVDASILFSVVKLFRADGGCLGTRSR
jgi:hypothetical protein